MHNKYMSYLLLGKSFLLIHILNTLNASKIHENTLDKIILPNSSMVGENFENSYLVFLKNSWKIHEILTIRQNHS